MRIVACLKQVVDTNLPLVLAVGGTSIDSSQLAFVMNPYDEFALEECLRIREKCGGEIIALTLGPSSCGEMLKSALALGADRAIHVVDEREGLGDPLRTGKLLSAAIGQIGEVDLVFCGRQAVDDDAFQVPAVIAQKLNMPLLSLAGSVSFDAGGKAIVVERKLEGGVVQALEASLPAVVTAQKGLNEPRFPSVMGMMQAKKKPVQALPAGDLGVDYQPAAALEKFSIPEVRRKMKIFENGSREAVREVVRLLREEERLLG